MLSLQQTLALLALTASVAQAWNAPVCEQAQVGFVKGSYTKDSFIAAWRPLCASACSASKMHYGFHVNSTTIENQLRADCYCCTLQTGSTTKCWDENTPYSPTDIFGPVKYPTHDLPPKMNPPVVEIDRKSCATPSSSLPSSSAPPSSSTKPSKSPCISKKPKPPTVPHWPHVPHYPPHYPQPPKYPHNPPHNPPHYPQQPPKGPGKDCDKGKNKGYQGGHWKKE